MIAMSRGLGPLGLPVVPAGSPAAAAAPGGAPAGAFDAAFAELTQALLATAAGAGQPAPATAKGQAMPAGESATESAEGGEDAANGLAALTVPVPVPVPTPLTAPVVAMATATAGDADATTIDGGPAPSPSPVARSSEAAAPDAASTTVATAVRATSTGAAVTTTAPAPSTTTSTTATSARAGSASATTTASVDADGDVTAVPVPVAGPESVIDETPVGLPIDPVRPEGLRRAHSAATATTEDAGGHRTRGATGAVGSASPSSTDRRMAFAPASTSTNDSGDVAGAKVTTAAPAETTTPMVAGPALVSEAPPLPAAGLARRAEALQRALGRRSEAASGETNPDGLAAQVVRLVDAPAAETAGSAAGAPQTGEFQQQMRRQARQGVAGGAMPAAAAAPSAGAPVQVDGHVGAAHDADTAAAPTWRAAALAARFAEPAAPVELARASAPVAPAAALLSAEAPLLRDVRAATIEAPVRLAEPAVADDVQTQIVKSMRLQWAGGAGEARVTLKPEYLGEVVATIKVEQGVVTATLQADTAEVRRLLETQTASLREALVEHGLKLDRVVVSEPETPAGQPGDRRPRGRQPQPPPSRQRRRQRDDDAGGATFELTE